MQTIYHGCIHFKTDPYIDSHSEKVKERESYSSRQKKNLEKQKGSWIIIELLCSVL
jgi:hypothetical protein